MYDEGHPRGLWRLGKIEDFVPSSDERVRGVYVKVVTGRGQLRVLRRPVQHIYPLEVRPNSPDPLEPPANESATTTSEVNHNRPVRKSATQARDRILGCLNDN